MQTLTSKGATMARKYVDCREVPSESKCTVAISADSEKELLEVAVQHAVKVHGHKDTAEFRQVLKQAIKQGSPPA
jgi:predicted small metal-binding protein